MPCVKGSHQKVNPAWRTVNILGYTVLSSFIAVEIFNVTKTSFASQMTRPVKMATISIFSSSQAMIPAQPGSGSSSVHSNGSYQESAEQLNGPMMNLSLQCSWNCSSNVCSWKALAERRLDCPVSAPNFSLVWFICARYVKLSRLCEPRWCDLNYLT